MFSRANLLSSPDIGNSPPEQNPAPPPQSEGALRETCALAELRAVAYKVAGSREEREGAFRLVYDAYTRRGLMDVNAYTMRVTEYHLLAATDVYIATHRGQVIYTMTLIGDDELGLPLEGVYAQEIIRLRRKGLYLAEVSCLAAEESYFEGNGMFEVFVNLLSLMLQSARANGVDSVVMAVHPRHARFYQRLLGCRQIGELRPYASVCNNPAVALEHNFARLDRDRYRLYDRIYRSRFQRWELLPQPMPPEDREYFRPAMALCGPSIPMAIA